MHTFIYSLNIQVLIQWTQITRLLLLAIQHTVKNDIISTIGMYAVCRSKMYAVDQQCTCNKCFKRLISLLFLLDFFASFSAFISSCCLF